MKTKNIAFTLAETLVVMGIIGVIAALTIPNLSQSTNNRERVVKVKKTYAALSEAFDRAQAVYGPADEWFTSGMTSAEKSTRFGQRVTEFMKLSKDCKTGTGCFNPKNQVESNTMRYKVVTSDGVSLCFFWNTGYLFSEKHLPLGIDFDIDGPNSKMNKGGKNLFFFYVTKNEGIQPGGSNFTLPDLEVAMKAGRLAHAAWIINYDNMDYLKADSNWKCPNGTVLNLSATPPITSCN